MLPWYQHIPFFSIVLMMIAGIFTSIVHRGRAALAVHLCAVSAVLAGNVALFANIVPAGETFTYNLGIVGHPFGNELVCGPLEVTLALTFLTVMALCVLGGYKGIFEDIEPEKQNLYFVMCDLIMASLLAMVYTNDAFTAYVFIEINTISACALVMAKDSGATLVATIRYLMMSLLGSGMFLMGLTLLYHITGHLLIIDIHEQVVHLAETGSYLLPLTVVMGLMTLGLCLKSALFPFHTWLPDAHGSATTSSSAILSGLVLKGYIVLLIKCIFSIFGEHIFRSFHVGDALLVMGVAAMVYGSVKAMGETHIKRMIAYSSVAQIGYIYLGFGLGGEAAAAAAIGRGLRTPEADVLPPGRRPPGQACGHRLYRGRSVHDRSAAAGRICRQVLFGGCRPVRLLADVGCSGGSGRVQRAQRTVLSPRHHPDLDDQGTRGGRPAPAPRSQAGGGSRRFHCFAGCGRHPAGRILHPGGRPDLHRAESTVRRKIGCIIICSFSPS